MYLKNIEVHGFKSFAQKINFEFHNGITGIVGPNGSGKSNVGDAVRWVLGEQSAKQLRGGNMQDVIFSGTETRKPLSFASVAITLDNSDHKLPVDFNEVTVTRRLYRSGESEYLINGSACRLKDINEMFYDTGIGKEGYSIIGQGQIDKILSGKPEERRELFDEAAGIVKFKRRKATTIKKLQDEQANLVRVTDILSELTRQLSPLERQSEIARIYLAKRDTLRELDVNSFLLENEETSRELKELDTKNTRAAEELEENQKAYEQTKVEYDRLEEELEQFIDSIQPKDKRNPSDIVPREKSLTDDEKKLFTYFVKVPGMREQLISALCDVQMAAADKTSKTGNVIVMGGKETGKTRLIASLIPAICKELNLPASKVAYVFADQLNEMDITKVIGKLSGGFLVIENANQLTQETVDILDKAMEFRTDGLTVIIEDEKIGMRKLIARFPKFAKKFTSMINIPVFTNDELVNFARVYTKENGYKIDQMGMLALYNLIGVNQKEDQPMNIGAVKEMLDAAMAKSQGGLLKFNKKKRVDRDGFTVLYEKDFAK